MTAYKLNLKSYKVTRSIAEGNRVVEKEVDYDVRDVMSNVMCHPSLEHKGFRFHTVAKLADRISGCKDNHLVLDLTDYDIIKSCFDGFKGFSRNDAQMVARVYDIEEIQVEEKKDGKKHK